MTSPESRREGRWRPVLFVLFAASFVTVIVVAYVRAERTIYYWDYVGYQEIAAQLTEAFARSFGAGLTRLADSLSHSYNAVFAVPLVPVLRTFGTGRLSYVLTVALLYHLPYVIVLGSIAACVSTGPKRAFDSVAVAMALLLPALWVPVLRGFPDTGAALLFAIGIRAYLADVHLRRSWQIPTIAVALVLACVVRRHFLVTLPAFLLAIAVTMLTDEAPSLSVRARVGRAASRLILLATAMLGSALLIAKAFVQLVLGRDYYTLYQSYMIAPLRAGRELLGAFGVIVAVWAAAGFVVGLHTKRAARGPMVFILSLGSFSALVWCAVIRQAGVQYALHLVPTIVVGIVALVTSLGQARPGWRRLAPAAGLGYLALAFPFGLSATADAIADSFPTVVSDVLLPTPALPLQRTDLETLRDLVATVRGKSDSKVPVLVVSSSPTLNTQILLHAERTFFGRAYTRLEVLSMPEVDSRDAYPVAALLDAAIVVLADPVQLHLLPQEQDLVTVTESLFDSGAAVATDFEPLGTRFQLEKNVTVTIHRRVRPTSTATALDTLARFEAKIPEVARHVQWLVVSRPQRSWVYRRPGDAARVVLHPALRGGDPPAIALHVPAMAGRISVSGRVEFVDGRCAGAELIFGPLGDPHAPATARAHVVRRPREDGRFSAALNVPKGDRLALDLTIPEGQSTSDYCLLSVNDLRASTADP